MDQRPTDIAVFVSYVYEMPIVRCYVAALNYLEMCHFVSADTADMINYFYDVHLGCQVNLL